MTCELQSKAADLSRTQIIEKAREGLLWGGGYRVFQIALQTTITLMLVRLLTPRDYGIYAVVASTIGLVNAISFENFLAHTLQVRRDDEVHFQDHFTAAFGLQSVVFAVSVGVAVTWGMLYGFAGTPLYLLAMSPVLLLSVFGSFRSYMLRRELNWRRARILLGLGIVASGASSIALAWAGWGVFALLLGPQVKYLPHFFDLFFVERWRPTFQWTWRNYVASWKFGLNRMASNYFSRGGEFFQQVGVAHFADLATLGYFGRALGLFRMSVIDFSSTATYAIYPVLTKFEPRTPEFARAASLVLRGICWVVVPTSVMVGLYSDVVIRYVFGEQWLDAILLVPLATGIGCTTAVTACVYQLSLANKQEKDCLYVDAAHFAGMTISIPLLAFGSLQSYMLGLLTTEVVIFVVLCWKLKQANGVTTAEVFKSLAEPAAATTLAVGTTFGMMNVAGWPPEAPLVTILSGISCGMLYVFVLRILFPQSFAELTKVAPAASRVARLLRLNTSLQNPLSA